MRCKVRKALGGRVSPCALYPDALKQNQNAHKRYFLASLTAVRALFPSKETSELGFCHNSNFCCNSLCTQSWRLKKFFVLHTHRMYGTVGHGSGSGEWRILNTYSMQISIIFRKCPLYVHISRVPGQFQGQTIIHLSQIAQKFTLGVDNYVRSAPERVNYSCIAPRAIRLVPVTC